MSEFKFNDHEIRWTRFGEFEPRFDYAILDVDEDARIIDLLFKFPAHGQVVMHRHLAPNHTFVVQGNHRLYDPNGNLNEDRPSGRYTIIPDSEVPHREGGGDEESIVFFSIRAGDSDDLYELLDDDMNRIDVITFPMMVELFRAAQEQVAVAA